MARIGVIGAGRVGAVLAAAFREAGHEIVSVAGESAASRIRIQTLLPGVAVDKPSVVARAADVLLVAVPDDALRNVVAMLSAAGAIRDGQYVVHTSGRHGTGVLAPAAERGARVAAMHPAMTFTGTDLDLPRLPATVFGCTGAADVRPVVDGLVGLLGARTVWVGEEQRVRYHAALAHGANHLVTLVHQASELLRGAGVDAPADVVRPLMQAALDNALAYGDAALTGPIARGDVQTVREHLRTLADAPPETLESYVAMGRATANLAARDGRLDPARAAAIVGLLDDALPGVRS
ncbi:MAG TPA: DUF2520 domain-containing protein [Nocardioidaceae bacterium]|nr:DUF2520 domain-containing protein [Nocardioidaceae bacterium]